MQIAFDGGRIEVGPLDLLKTPELAAQLSLRERVRLALRDGPITREALRSELEDVKEDTFRKIVNREKKAGRLLEFPDGQMKLPGGEK